ncbi:hypothetical protein ES703_99323 [subsurface metagenome]
MIIEGHQYRYTARRGKLTWRYGQTATVLHCQATQIVVRFPDGYQAHVEARFLQPIKKP